MAVRHGSRVRSWWGALDALPAHIAVLDRDGCIVAANRAWRDFGAANGLALRHGGVGVSYLSACESSPLSDHDARAVATAIRDAAAGSPATFERRYACHSTEELRWFLVRVVGFDVRGERRVMVSHENITSMVQSEMARDRADRARDDFLSLVSHELRTPITMIYGNARILRDHGDVIDRTSGAEAIADVESEATHLRRLVDNMLAISRIEQGEDVALEPTLVRPSIEYVVSKWRRISPLSHFELDIDENLPPVIADPHGAELVLDNLISNACESSPPHGEIEIAAHLDDDCVSVSVSDRGDGLQPGEEAAIFEPFRKGGGRARFAPGVGIGLTACKRLIEAMGGTIWATAREGGGARVTFAIPAATE